MLSAGRYLDAVAPLNRALDQARNAQDVRGEVTSLHDLGTLYADRPGEGEQTAASYRRAIEQSPNLLDYIDSVEFAELIAGLEASLDVDLPRHQVDVASIAHIDRLIDVICKHG